MGRKKMHVVTADEVSATIQINDGPGITMDGLAEVVAGTQKLFNRYEVRKAKLKDGNFMEVEFNETLPDSTNSVKKDCTALVHPDLKEAFRRMDHLLLEACEQQDDSDVECTGFTLGKDSGGVTLIGNRALSRGNTLNLTSPYIKFDDSSDVEHAINVARQEVLLYLFESKHAPDQQLSLDFDNGTSETPEDF